MDRKITDNSNRHSELVALRKESVDRKIAASIIRITSSQSLSARRAWIEMLKSAEDEAPEVSLSARRV